MKWTVRKHGGIWWAHVPGCSDYYAKKCFWNNCVPNESHKYAMEFVDQCARHEA